MHVAFGWKFVHDENLSQKFSAEKKEFLLNRCLSIPLRRKPILAVLERDDVDDVSADHSCSTFVHASIKVELS
jgi:hypothetical protein